MNIIERNLAQKAHLDIIKPRDRVILEPNLLCMTEKSTLGVIEKFRELGYQKVHHPTQSFFTVGAELHSSESAEIKVFCKKNGINLIEQEEKCLENFLDKNEHSLDELVVASSDSTIGLIGAYGAIPLIVSQTSMARCLGTGKLEMVIPETIYIEINGFLQNRVTAESFLEYLLDYFKSSLVGYGIIIGGNTIERFDYEDRRKMMRFIYKSGGALGIISPSGPLGQVESCVKIKAQHIFG